MSSGAASHCYIYAAADPILGYSSVDRTFGPVPAVPSGLLPWNHMPMLRPIHDLSVSVHSISLLLIVSTLSISSRSFPTRILSVYFGLTLRPSSHGFAPRVCFGLSPCSISELFPIHFIHVLGFSFMFSFYGR